MHFYLMLKTTNLVPISANPKLFALALFNALNFFVLFLQFYLFKSMHMQTA